MRATAVAHSNIALVKYWGKRHESDPSLNLAAVGSISITLAGMTTTTSVSFGDAPGPDRVLVSERGRRLTEDPRAVARVSALLDHIRRLAGLDAAARVETDNDFPTGAGLASSASGFAALTIAAAEAAGLEATPEALCAIARRGSGSAARSIFGGFAEMDRGVAADGHDAVARQLAPPDHWPLEVVVCVTDPAPKAVGSTEGMERTRKTSPYYAGWLASQAGDLAAMRDAIAGRDFTRLAELTEHSCLKMHALMMSAQPPLQYWRPATLELMTRIRELRRSGVGVCYTIDAGPQVKAVCEPGAAERVAAALGGVVGVERIIRASLGEGARLISRETG